MNPNNVKNCTRCNANLEGYCSMRYSEDVCKEVICWTCNHNEAVLQFKKDGVLTSTLTIVVAIASACDENIDRPLSVLLKSGYRPEFAIFVDRNRAILRQVKKCMEELDIHARMTEIALWYGRPELALPDYAEHSFEKSRRIQHENCERYISKKSMPRNKKDIMALGKASVWAIYNKSKYGLSFKDKALGCKIMVLGSAGRVLITIQDMYNQGHKDSKFGGANITLIVGDSKENDLYPNGGIQSKCGTLRELLSLLEAARKADPKKFKPDDKVNFGF